MFQPALGSKRSHDDTEPPKMPTSAEFTFTPMPQPHQKLFSFGSDPSTWSAAVLTRRYQQNAKEVKERARAQAHQTQLTPSSVHLAPPPPPPSDIVPANLSTYFYHRSVSLTIMSYVRLIFTVSLLSILFYVVSQLIWTLKHDLQAKAEEHTRDLVHEIRVCAYNYKENLCDPGTRLPAMEDLCQKWLACMNQLPTTVTRAKLTAETLAEIVNSFVEPISYKTMLFFSILVFGTILLSNLVVHRLPRINSQ